MHCSEVSSVWWLEKTGFTRTTQPLRLPVLVAFPRSLPVRELHVNLFLMGNYLLSSFGGRGGRGGYKEDRR